MNKVNKDLVITDQELEELMIAEDEAVVFATTELKDKHRAKRKREYKNKKHLDELNEYAYGVGTSEITRDRDEEDVVAVIRHSSDSERGAKSAAHRFKKSANHKVRHSKVSFSERSSYKKIMDYERTLS